MNSQRPARLRIRPIERLDTCLVQHQSTIQQHVKYRLMSALDHLQVVGATLKHFPQPFPFAYRQHPPAHRGTRRSDQGQYQTGRSQTKRRLQALTFSSKFFCVFLHNPSNTETKVNVMIILGIILIVLGLLLPALVPTFAYAHICLIIGIILLVVGLILLVMGRMGRAVGGRRHYY
jgi:hypothetical protein